MKAILVIDKPIECDGCPCLNYNMWYCQADPKHRDGGDDYVPEWCPLKPMPERMKVDYDTISSAEVTEKVVAIGWNACLEDLEK